MYTPKNTSIIDFAYPEDHPLRYTYPQVESNDDISAEYIEQGDNMEINRQAMALFDFTPENDNEVALTEGQVIWISYRHGQGWLVAEDPISGENGLVPEEYVDILDHDKAKEDSEIEDEWVDTDDEIEDVDEELKQVTIS